MNGVIRRIAESDVIVTDRLEDSFEMEFRGKETQVNNGSVEQMSGNQRGVALVTTMLVMSLMLMLSLAVTFTALSDNSVTSNFKNSTKGFYAAEAGINNVHRMVHSDQFVMGSLPNPPRVTPGQPTLDASAFTTAAQNFLNTTETFANDAQYKTNIKITEFVTPYPADDNNPAHVGARVTYVNPQFPNQGQIEPYSVKYTINSVGEGIAGINGTVTLEEQGAVNFNLLTSQSSGGLRVGSFAEFALFTDHFDPYHPDGPFLYQGFGPGDRFSGRVHTNERFGFWTDAYGQEPPVFKGLVTQSYSDASYYRFGSMQPPPPVNANSEVVDGVLVAPQFEAGFQRGAAAIPPTNNAYNQASAVLDGGYSLSSTSPTDQMLDGALRAANQLNTALPPPKDPTSTTPDLANGIYIPTDGESFTGSGVYVVGDASQIQLTADPSGNRQIIKITQGASTVTMVVDVDAGTTTIDAGNGVRTLRGIPMDRSTSSPRPGASLFVYGNVNSLSGPGRDSNGQPLPAVDSDFAMTVTAAGHTGANPNSPVQGGNITITGDMTYETPVVDALGNPINQNAQNYLGVFASGGNIQIPIDGRAPSNLTIDGSLAAFQMKDAQGNPIVGADGKPYGGRIRSDLSNWGNVGDMGRLTVVGGMQSSTYDNFGVYDGSMHGYSYQGLWDGRYDHNQSPPFYPGYLVNMGAPTGTPVVTLQKSSPTVLSYKRVYYGVGRTTQTTTGQ